MSEVKRYDPIEYPAIGSAMYGQMLQDDFGDYVEFEVFEKYDKAIREAIECLNQICHEKGSTLEYRNEVVAKLKKVVGDE